jgi:hypothetical protein
MRRVSSAACLVALLCGGCAAQAVAPQPVAQRSVDDFKVWTKPSGYYPGIAQAISDTPELSAWLTANQPRIDEVQNRIAAIRAGKAAPGCIGQDKFTCVATLAQRFAITDSYTHPDAGIVAATNASVVAATKYDVNGKPVNGTIEFYGFVPDANADNDPSRLRRATKFELRLGRDGLVASFRARLPQDPTFAHTQEQYDATDAYETVAALVAKKCPDLSRAEVAKWIENTIKPNSTSARGRIRRGLAAAKISRKTAFCGRTFQFASVWASQTYNQFRRDAIGGMFVSVE